MIGEAARKRRAERNERVAEVRALGIKVGDWIVTGTYGRIVRATPDTLDARADMFQYLRRATPKEIAAQEAKEADLALEFFSLPLMEKGGRWGSRPVTPQLEARRNRIYEKLRDCKSQNRSKRRKARQEAQK